MGTCISDVFDIVEMGRPPYVVCMHNIYSDGLRMRASDTAVIDIIYCCRTVLILKIIRRNEGREWLDTDYS